MFKPQFSNWLAPLSPWMTPGLSVLDNPGHPRCLPRLRLLRVWVMRFYFSTKISLDPRALIPWIQSRYQRRESEPKVTTQASPEGVHVQEIPQDTLPNQVFVSARMKGKTLREGSRRTIRVSNRCNLSREELMFYCSPRPVVS